LHEDWECIILRELGSYQKFTDRFHAHLHCGVHERISTVRKQTNEHRTWWEKTTDGKNMLMYTSEQRRK